MCRELLQRCLRFFGPPKWTSEFRFLVEARRLAYRNVQSRSEALSVASPVWMYLRACVGKASIIQDRHDLGPDVGGSVRSLLGHAADFGHANASLEAGSRMQQSAEVLMRGDAYFGVRRS